MLPPPSQVLTAPKPSSNIDVTIDLETLSLTANAAILQISAVAWNRTADHPYAVPYEPVDDSPSLTWRISPFTRAIDLRSCIDIGLDFDPSTIEWWQRQSQDARQSVLRDGAAVPLRETMADFIKWLNALPVAVGFDDFEHVSITLWSQGSDFDIAILRNVMRRLGPEFEDSFRHIVPHTSFRDARTFILELGKCLHGYHISQAPMTDHHSLYSAFPTDPFWVCTHPHDSLYDACRTSWQLWHLFNTLRLSDFSYDDREQ